MLTSLLTLLIASDKFPDTLRNKTNGLGANAVKTEFVIFLIGIVFRSLDSLYWTEKSFSSQSRKVLECNIKRDV